MATKAKVFLSLVLVVLLFSIAGTAEAQTAKVQDSREGGTTLDIITSVPRTMTYQGILKDGDGNPNPNATVDIIFRIYDDPLSGELEWDEEIAGVQTDGGGYFSVELTDLNIPFDEDYWMELEIDNEILSPRQKLNMSAYSARSDTCDYALSSAADGDWVISGDNMYSGVTDNVGIGISNPTNKLHIYGSDSAPLLNVEKVGPGRGLRVNTTTACALWVDNSGNHGLRVTHANGDGINITDAGNDGIHVDNAGNWAGYFNGSGYFSGNVGIGTAGPTEQLDVAGTAQMTGFKMLTDASDGYVLTSDGSGIGTWQAAAGGGSNWSVTDSVLYTNNYWGIARGGVGNVLYGDSSHTHINLGIACTTGTNFENYRYSTVGGGYRNTASDHWSTVGGGRQNAAIAISATVSGGKLNSAIAGGATVSGGGFNTANSYGAISGGSENIAGSYASVGGGSINGATGDYSAIGGGELNIAYGYSATVGGGAENNASYSLCTIGGGYQNTASGERATVGGGSENNARGLLSVVSGGGGITPADSNSAVGDYSAIGGGRRNIASGGNAMVGGGSHNSAGGNQATVGGGSGNNSSQEGSTVGGGNSNTSSAMYATVSGGFYNTANGYSANVGGGANNTASGQFATVAGGSENIVISENATVSGGNSNGATNSYATVGGGVFNFAYGLASVIAGGSDNTADGDFSAIPGGVGNAAGGHYSLAAGRRAKANHNGAFVWADTTNADFVSTGDNQFLIRAAGGVGIGTVSPTEQLDVAGTAQMTGIKIPTGASNGYVLTSDASGIGTWQAAGGSGGWTDDGTVVRLDSGTDSVGIGTTTPSEKLDVAGRAQMTGFKMPTGASDGYVLTSDSNGIGTWQGAAGGNAWVLTGNAGTTPGTHFVGTTDDQALEFHVNNNRALRLEPNELFGSPITANVIGGSWGNTVASGMSGATICGGGGTGDYINQVTYSWGFVGGGNGNTAAENAATVGGGAMNTASGSGSTVSGGYSDSATGYTATVGGGFSNLASGEYSTVSGGRLNTAAGGYSFAAGRRAKANHNGAFVWADGYNADFTSSANNQFNVRASGGTRIFSNSDLTAGVLLNAGASSWSSVSDSTLKRNIRPVDGRAILEKLSRLTISRWSYKAQDESIEHIGPMAQDFYALFGLGEDDKHISTLDPDGVALVAIQELCRITKDQKVEIEALKSQLSEIQNTLRIIMAEHQSKPNDNNKISLSAINQ